MSNTLLTIGQITREALMVLENELTFTKMCNREYSDQFARDGAKIGTSVNIRKPPRYVGRTGATFTAEGSTETSVALTLDTQFGVDLSYTSQERTTDIDDFSERFLKPAIATIANKIDYDGLQQYKNIYNVVGTGGTTPSTMKTYLDAGVKMDFEAAPQDGNRNVVMNPVAQATLVNADRALFSPGSTISTQYLKGKMADNSNGFNWAMDQNIAVHTVGTYVAAAGAVTVTTSVSTGNSIVTGGWTSGDILNKGDVITFANVYAVNPQNRQSTGQLRQFVVTAAATASGGGAMTVTVSPALVFSGQGQTCTSTTASVASTSTVTILTGTSALQTPQNLAFHRDAFTLASADLLLPASGVIEADRVKSKKLGMSLRMISFYDGFNDRLNTRFDVLYGWATLRPELAVRVLG